MPSDSEEILNVWYSAPRDYREIRSRPPFRGPRDREIIPEHAIWSLLWSHAEKRDLLVPEPSVSVVRSCPE